jgi:hypothetical protein
MNQGTGPNKKLFYMNQWLTHVIKGGDVRAKGFAPGLELISLSPALRGDFLHLVLPLLRNR